MKNLMINTAALAVLTLTLAACDRPTVVAVPAANPTIVVPGPAGPPGATGSTGAPGKPGDSGTTPPAPPKQ